MNKTSFYNHTAAWNLFPFLYGEALDFSLIPWKKLICAYELIVRRNTTVLFLLSSFFNIKK